MMVAGGSSVPPPVRVGTASHTVLVANLANRVQPVIRYDLGDSITVLPDPCPCGSQLMGIRPEGRRDDVLALPARAGCEPDPRTGKLRAVSVAAPAGS